MAVYLLKVDEAYRCDTEREATELIENAKTSDIFHLAKFTSVLKQARAKGEVIDEWYRVTLTKVFTKEREPDQDVSIAYEKNEFTSPKVEIEEVFEDEEDFETDEDELDESLMEQLSFINFDKEDSNED